MTFLVSPYRFSAPAAAASISYAGFKKSPLASTTTTSTHTISAAAIGTAAADRRVFCVVYWLANTPKALVSATIGGVAATIHVQSTGQSTSGFYSHAAIISAPLAAGTTADVVVVITSGSSDYNVWVASYAAYGLASSTAGDTASDTSLTFGGTGSVTIDVTEDGILLAGMIEYSDATGFTVGGTAGAAENHDTSLFSSRRAVSASLDVAATAAGQTVSFTRTGGGGSSWAGGIVAAAFR